MPCHSPSEAGIDISSSLESTFLNAVASNCPVSEDEARLFTEQILLPAARMSTLDGDVASLESQLAEAKERSLDLKTSLNQWRRVVSPLRRLATGLPPELLAEVFGWLCDEAVFNVFRSNSGPWLLAQICRRWREIALATPSLWCAFKIGLRSIKFTDGALCIKLQRALARALELSASAFLYIDCDINGFDDVDDDDDDGDDLGSKNAQLVLDLLMTQAERWREVNLGLSLAQTPSLQRLNGRLPVLRSLCVTVDRGDELGHEHIAGFRSAPQLVDITLNAIVFERFEFPLHSLQKLCLTWVCQHEDPIQSACGTSFQRLHYLKDSQNLSFFGVLHMFDDEYDPDAPGYLPPLSPPLVHHRLATLHVSDVRFIRSVTLPSLRHLAVVEDKQNPLSLAPSFSRCSSSMTAAVAGLLERSQCHLKSLLLPDTCDTTSCLRLAHLTPQLESLTLHYSYWGPETEQCLIALFTEIAHHNAMPRLTSIVIGITRNTYWRVSRDRREKDEMSFIGSEFGDFVRHRWLGTNLGVARLESISVEIQSPAFLRCAPGSRTLLNQLREFKADGLDISIIAEDTQTPLHEWEDLEQFYQPRCTFEWDRGRQKKAIGGMIYV